MTLTLNKTFHWLCDQAQARIHLFIWWRGKRYNKQSMCTTIEECKSQTNQTSKVWSISAITASSTSAFNQKHGSKTCMYYTSAFAWHEWINGDPSYKWSHSACPTWAFTISAFNTRAFEHAASVNQPGRQWSISASYTGTFKHPVSIVGESSPTHKLKSS